MKPSFLQGLTFWIRGWRLLVSHRSLMLLAVIPFLISISVAGITLSYVYSHLPDWVQILMDHFLAGAPSLLTYLYYPLLVGTSILVLFAGIFVAFLGQSIIAVPFYALLAERALFILGLKQEEPFQFSRWLKHSLRMLRVSLIKSLLFLVLGATLFALSFVPVVNVAAMFGTLLILSFDLLDYSFEALHYGFRQRVRFAGSHKRMWAGMAVGLGLTMFAPGLTFVIAPGAVVGAALMMRENLNGFRTPAP